MTVTFSDTIRDKFIAPGVSAFTSAEIPDMSAWSKESAHWVGNLFLNSAFRGSFYPPQNAYIYNFIRRAQYAFSEHGLARTSTLRFITNAGQNPQFYADALFHWECYLGQAWHAFATLAKAWDGKVFQKNDQSIEQRLNAMYNRMKHVESCIENGQMILGATVPVWLENEGLRSVDVTLSYDETGEVLKELAKFADALSDPKSAKAVLSENVPK